MKKTLRKSAGGILRLGVGLGIIIFLLFKVNLREMLAVMRSSLQEWPWLAMALAIYALCLWLGIGRWKIILNAQGLRMAWSRVFCIFSIGQFFNSFMFGSTGGDLARAYYAARETHHRKTAAVATVVIDRMIGLVVLNFIAGAMLVLRFNFYSQHWATHLPAIFMIGMISATILGLLIIYNIRFFKGWPIFRSIEHHPTLAPVIRRVLISIYLYHRRKETLLKTAALTFVIHLLIVAQCYCLGKSLQINISLLDYLTVIPLIIALSAVPITPGGLGIREGLAVTMLGALDVNPSQSLPLALMLYFITIIISLLGGFIFLGYTTGAGRTVHEEIIELEGETAGKNRQIRVAGPHE